ncbi:MAG: LamG-like jellyroll fold domain-containing protein [Bacilli bacterium]
MIKSKSFTLIELLVVIVIIGILAGVIMISTSSSIDKANFAKAQAFSKTVQNELFLNLISEWTFDNNSSRTEDSWGSSNGTVLGTLEYYNSSSGNCISGGCYYFSGDDYITTLPTTDLVLQNYTFSFWAKVSSFSQYHGLLEIYSASATANNYIGRFMTFGGTSIRFHPSFHDNSNAYVQISNNQVDEWMYFVGTYNGLKGVVYKNGAYVQECNLAGPITYFDSTYANIGINAYASDRKFIGLIDDIRIYNTALSFSQIKQNYIAGLDSLLSKGSISKEHYNQRLEALAGK